MILTYLAFNYSERPNWLIPLTAWTSRTEAEKVFKDIFGEDVDPSQSFDLKEKEGENEEDYAVRYEKITQALFDYFFDQACDWGLTFSLVDAEEGKPLTRFDF